MFFQQMEIIAAIGRKKYLHNLQLIYLFWQFQFNSIQLAVFTKT